MMLQMRDTIPLRHDDRTGARLALVFVGSGNTAVAQRHGVMVLHKAGNARLVDPEP